MSDTRVHLRFAQELLPWASVDALRHIILLPVNVATVGGVVRAIAARFQPQGAFVLTLKGSRFHEADPAAVIRDEDVLHLVRVATLPSPRAERAACECGTSASHQFSARQWSRLCKGREARCQQCAAGLQAVRCARGLTEDPQNLDSGGSDNDSIVSNGGNPNPNGGKRGGQGTHHSVVSQGYSSDDSATAESDDSATIESGDESEDSTEDSPILTSRGKVKSQVSFTSLGSPGDSRKVKQEIANLWDRNRLNHRFLAKGCDGRASVDRSAGAPHRELKVGYERKGAPLPWQFQQANQQ